MIDTREQALRLDDSVHSKSAVYSGIKLVQQHESVHRCETL